MKHSSSGLRANPFAMMLDPEQVLTAIEQSSELSSLKLRKFRPLDRPWIPLVSRELAEADAAIDREPDAWPVIDLPDASEAVPASGSDWAQPTSWPRLDAKSGH